MRAQRQLDTQKTYNIRDYLSSLCLNFVYIQQVVYVLIIIHLKLVSLGNL